jgi:hypothetical protein
VVDRPVRRGREAYYDFRHLSQFMATRWMLQDGWLLAKIAEVTATRSTPDLLSIIPEAPSNAAQELIQRFKKTVPSSSEPITNRQARLLQQRVRTRNVLPGLGNAGAVVQRRELVQLDLTDWCRVLIDADRLAGISPQDASRLGEVLATALSETGRDTIRAAAKRHSRKGKKP